MPRVSKFQIDNVLMMTCLGSSVAQLNDIICTCSILLWLMGLNAAMLTKAIDHTCLCPLICESRKFRSTIASRQVLVCKCCKSKISVFRLHLLELLSTLIPFPVLLVIVFSLALLSAHQTPPHSLSIPETLWQQRLVTHCFQSDL